MELFFCAIPVIAKGIIHVCTSWPVSWLLWLVGQVFRLPVLLWDVFWSGLYSLVGATLLFLWSNLFSFIGLGVLLFAAVMLAGGCAIALQSPDYNDGYYTRRSGSCP
jgi:hypothetical protein